MILSLTDKIINIFFEVDEILKKNGHKDHYHSMISDSEIITLMVFKVHMSIKSEKDFHQLINERFKDLFPKLPEYSRYLKRVKNCGYMAYKLIEEISFKDRDDPDVKEKDDLYIIDTKPIPILERARANRSVLVKIFNQWRIKPNYGYCAARQMKYFGFKLVCLWNKGKIVTYTLVSANASEQTCLMKLVEKANLHDINMFGDKGFILNINDKNDLSKKNIKVEAIPRKNMKVIIEKLGYKKYKRKGIESCFSVLRDFDIERLTFRSVFGLISNINQRILAYNLRDKVV